MKKTILTIVFCLQPLVCFGFNWEINDFGAIDKYSPGPGESKLILNTDPGKIVKIDAEEVKIEGGQRLSVILPIGLHTIQFGEKSFFSDSFRSLVDTKVLLTESTISILNVGTKVSSFVRFAPSVRP